VEEFMEEGVGWGTRIETGSTFESDEKAVIETNVWAVGILLGFVSGESKKLDSR
jgi:hypothetical protein